MNTKTKTTILPTHPPLIGVALTLGRAVQLTLGRAVAKLTNPAKIAGMVAQLTQQAKLAGIKPAKLAMAKLTQPAKLAGITFALALIAGGNLAHAQVTVRAGTHNGDWSNVTMVPVSQTNSTLIPSGSLLSAHRIIGGGVFSDPTYYVEGNTVYVPFAIGVLASETTIRFELQRGAASSGAGLIARTENIISSYKVVDENGADITNVELVPVAEITNSPPSHTTNVTLAANTNPQDIWFVFETNDDSTAHNIPNAISVTSEGTGVTNVSPSSWFATIYDNDRAVPTLTIRSGGTGAAGHFEEGNSVQFVITADPAPTSDLMVPVVIDDPQNARTGYRDCEYFVLPGDPRLADRDQRQGVNVCTNAEYNAGVPQIIMAEIVSGQTESLTIGVATRDDDEYKAASIFASILESANGDYNVQRTDIGDGHLVSAKAESFVIDNDILVEPAIIGADEGENLRFRVTADTRGLGQPWTVDYQLGQASVNLTTFKQVVDRRDFDGLGFYPAYHKEFVGMTFDPVNQTIGDPNRVTLSPFGDYGKADKFTTYPGTPVNWGGFRPTVAQRLRMANARCRFQTTPCMVLGNSRAPWVDGGDLAVPGRTGASFAISVETEGVNLTHVFAPEADVDYRADATGTLTFPVGTGAQFITVPTLADGDLEAHEVVQLLVSKARTDANAAATFDVQEDFGNIGIGVIVDGAEDAGMTQVNLRGDRGFPEEGGDVNFVVSADRVLDEDLLVQLYVDGRVSHFHHESIVVSEDYYGHDQIFHNDQGGGLNAATDTSKVLIATNGTRRLSHVVSHYGVTYPLNEGNRTHPSYNRTVGDFESLAGENTSVVGMPAREHYIGVVIPAGSRSTSFQLTAVANVTDRVEVRLVDFAQRNQGRRVVDKRYFEGNPVSLTGNSAYELKSGERIPLADTQNRPLRFNGTHVVRYERSDVPESHWQTACADDMVRGRWTGSAADCVAASMNGTHDTLLNPRLDYAFRARPANGGTGEMQAWYDVGNPRIAVAQAGVSNLVNQPGEDTIEEINMETLAHVASEFFDESSSLISERVANRISGSLAGRFGFTVDGSDVTGFIRREAQREANENPWDDPTTRQASLVETTDWHDLAFAVPLHGGDAGGIGVWGTGFTRSLGYGVANTNYDGTINGGIAGVDFYVTPHLLAGIGFSSATAEIDLTPRGTGADGTHETEITGYHPYLGYELEGGGSVWATLGVANGDVTLTRQGVPGAYRAEIESTSYGAGFTNLVDRQSVAGGSVSLSVKGDAQYAAIEESPDARNNVTAGYANSGSNEADASHVRLGVVVEHHRDLDGGGVLTKSFELAGRYDMGDAREGQGVELGAGVGLDTADGLQFDLNARSLILHADNVDEDWGIAGSVAWLSPAARRSARGAGLSLRFEPRWGGQAVADGVNGALFDRGVDGVVTAGADGSAGDAGLRYYYDVRYGIPLLRQGEGLLMPFVYGDAGGSGGAGASADGEYAVYGTQFSYGGMAAGVESLREEERGYIRYERDF
ncbi:MAG: autotransporter outer membrane beta-barrel domain-containing protein [Proteobacteria bacterium]|nr:autotransporter outer membrane beta-barrel domain-containing protein [Pseudomonadota bacterium]